MLDRFGDDAVIEYLNNKLAPNILMDIALETGAKIEGRGIVSALRTNYVTIETNY